MRYILTWTDNKKGGWRTLYEQFRQELGLYHSMTSTVGNGCDSTWNYRVRAPIDFLDYDQME
jgi:hypothetical protein